jgi:ubiquinone/menaquinone biosynthesis C-methylase UbiE
MSNPTSETAERERAFWNDVAREEFAHFDPKAYAVTAESRFDGGMPWLPYLGVPSLVDAVLDAVGDVRGKTILDLGCGSGFLSVLLAKRGATRVIGIDVSEEQLEIARFRARASGLNNDDPALEFQAVSADRLDFADQTFDAVVGAFVLHHLDLPKTAKEIYRVLKPNGVGAFIETSARNPFLMAARTLAVGKFGIPKFGSADERPLGKTQEKILADIFPRSLKVRTPVLISMRMASAYLKPFRIKPLAAMLRGIDGALGSVPLFRRWSYYNVVVFRRLHPAPSPGTPGDG